MACVSLPELFHTRNKLRIFVRGVLLRGKAPSFELSLKSALTMIGEVISQNALTSELRLGSK